MNKKNKVVATRTTNPLHFEDLESKRFETLTRQLAYGFRSWRKIEPTGLLGNDEGVDIWAVEIVDLEDSSKDRDWSFQCKRYQSLGPKEIRKIVRETTSVYKSPYGIVIATACDISSDAIRAFHDEASKLGIKEPHFWSKSHLEDMLFRPENDNLLFAYFNISLTIRHRDKIQNIRQNISNKRKILSALGAKIDDTVTIHSVDMYSNSKFIVRDIEDETYPTQIISSSDMLPWHHASFVTLNDQHVVLGIKYASGWVKPDGSWDFDPEYLTNESHSHDQPNDEEANYQRDKLWYIQELIPNNELQSIRIAAYLPYSSILEVDSIGDPSEKDQISHIFCIFKDKKNGPYDGYNYIYFAFDDTGYVSNLHYLDPSKRDRSLFSDLKKNLDLSKKAIQKWRCDKHDSLGSLLNIKK